MFLLIVIDENEKERFFGPFDNGDEALDWGVKNLNSDYFLMATKLENPDRWADNKLRGNHTRQEKG